MRRSFGGGSSRGMAGGMIRSVQRAVRAAGAAPEPFSPSANSTIAGRNSRKPRHFSKKQAISPNTALTLSSSNNGSNSGGTSAFPPLINFPVSTAPGAPAPNSSSTCSEESEWERADGSEDETVRGFHDDFVFASVPSRAEVEHAVFALQHAFVSSPKGKNTTEDSAGKDDVSDSEKGISITESEEDWIEPSLHFGNSRKLLQPNGSDRVYDAFHLLQTEPSVQRMVISLSSDKAIWDAVLNNEVVKELRGSIAQADKLQDESSSSSNDGADDSNPIKDLLGCIITDAKAKIMHLIDWITKSMSKAFQAPNQEQNGASKGSELFDEKLKMSLLLSVVVLMIVVITRARGA